MGNDRDPKAGANNRSDIIAQHQLGKECKDRAHSNIDKSTPPELTAEPPTGPKSIKNH